jgi:hypothetical protein
MRKTGKKIDEIQGDLFTPKAAYRFVELESLHCHKTERRLTETEHCS